MTPLFPAQRAAEEFDQVLAGTAQPAVADRYAELLDTVTMLHDQPAVTPRADFVADLRARLMTAAATELVAPSPVLRQPTTTSSTRNRRRLGSLAASLVLVGGSAGMAAAASGALPGETLYPVKRGVEQVSAALHFGDAGKGQALLDQASTRLDEARALQRQGNPDEALITSTVDAFRSAADQGSNKLFRAYQAGGDTGDITAVRTFTAQQMADVAAMSTASKKAPAGLLVEAADTLADIDQEARVLCGECGPGPALEPPRALSAGAGAATVDNLLRRPVTQARIDIKRAQAAEAVRVARLKAAAEESAGQIPTIPATPGVGATPRTPTLVAQRAPVTSTMTKDGHLVPSVTAGVTTSGVAVKGLVSGVTANLNVLVGTLTPKTPLSDGVQDLTHTVDKTVDGLLP